MKSSGQRSAIANICLKASRAAMELNGDAFSSLLAVAASRNDSSRLSTGHTDSGVTAKAGRVSMRLGNKRRRVGVGTRSDARHCCSDDDDVCSMLPNDRAGAECERCDDEDSLRTGVSHVRCRGASWYDCIADCMRTNTSRSWGDSFPEFGLQASCATGASGGEYFPTILRSMVSVSLSWHKGPPRWSDQLSALRLVFGFWLMVRVLK